MSENQQESVSLNEVRALRRDGLISDGQYLDAVYLCRDPAFWTRWSMRTLLALGVGHALAGVIFFFAYNWDSLSAFAKFAILETGIVVSVGLALILNLDKPAGKAFLISATVLVGVLLAVIGQVYQTGADAWSLFTTWALLTVPFALASRSAAHWLVWLVVAYVAANLFGYQVVVPYGVLDEIQVQCLISVTLAVVLLKREVAVRVGMQWLDAKWTRILPALASVSIVFLFAVAHVLDWERSVEATILFVGLIAVLAFVYARVLPDFAVIAVCAGFVALYLMAGKIDQAI